MQHALADMSAWIATFGVGTLMVRIGTAKKVLKIRRPRPVRGLQTAAGPRRLPVHAHVASRRQR